MAWVIETDVFFFSAHVPILGVDIWEHVRVDAVDVVRRLLTAVSQAFYLQVSLMSARQKSYLIMFASHQSTIMSRWT